MNNIETIDYPAPKQDYKVLVRCYTYNHSKYIEDALNGFALQQTNFPFVCLVVDDASTDGEQEVIMKWMEHECDKSRAETIEIATSIVIIVPHKSNPSCTFAFYLLKQNLYRVKGAKKRHIDPWREKCEYEAICEGDDYWIDPFKLQKQIIILDNKDCNLVYSQAKSMDSVTLGSKVKDFDDLLLGGNRIPTLTTCYRLSANKNYEEFIKKLETKRIGDYSRWLYLCMNSEVVFLPEITAIYRVLEESASHSKNINNLLDFNRDVYRIRTYFLQAKPYERNVYAQYKDRIHQEYKWMKFRLLYINNRKDEAFMVLNNEKLSIKRIILMFLLKNCSFMANYISLKWKNNL